MNFVRNTYVLNNMDSIENILLQFDSKQEDFKFFGEKMRILIQDLLVKVNQIKTHAISFRVKERASLKKKLVEKGKYTAISDVTDVVGVRIITLFEDEVDNIAQILDKEFEVDRRNSVDKRITQYNKFGYSSLHFIVSLKTSRSQLPEYQIFEGQKFEIQIRSILQHAWAEIEHDIGYKTQESIPDIAKRNFSRLSALLETADLEFIRLRNTLNQYGQDVNNDILIDPELVDLNSISIIAYDRTKKSLRELDQRISDALGTNLLTNSGMIVEWVPNLDYLGVKNIGQLSHLIDTRGDDIANLARNFSLLTNGKRGATKLFADFEIPALTSRGISIHYLCYLLVAEKGNLDFISEYLKLFISQDDVDKLTEEIMFAYRASIERYDEE